MKEAREADIARSLRQDAEWEVRSLREEVKILKMLLREREEIVNSSEDESEYVLAALVETKSKLLETQELGTQPSL